MLLAGLWRANNATTFFRNDPDSAILETSMASVFSLYGLEIQMRAL